MQKIVLGGGCFWCVEGALLGLKGVSSVIPGYSGGHTENPTYEEVCAKRSGHAEVVEVIFDEEIIPRRILLEVFAVIKTPSRPCPLDIRFVSVIGSNSFVRVNPTAPFSIAKFTLSLLKSKATTLHPFAINS